MRQRRKKLLLLALGGTIACRKTKDGLVPKLKARDLLEAVQLPRNIEVEGVDFLKRTIVFPADWIAIAKKIYRDLSNYDGFVITLGTDTLSYVAAALTLILGNLSRPVALTGAMKPIGVPASDAPKNLRDAILVASERSVGGVFVVFNGKIMDGGSVSKIRSDSVDAFESINFTPLGTISGNKILWNRRPMLGKGRPAIKPFFDSRVAVVKLTPNIHPEFFAAFKKYKGIVLEGYGDGNVSSNLVPVLKRLAKTKLIVLASQCTYGKASHKYEGGVALMRSGAISAGDMTKEAALVKLMWALGQSKNIAKARLIFEG